MHANIQTVAFRGIDTIAVNVQVHIANGLPAMAIVGLADKSVAESKERVRAALTSIGLSLPPKRIAINLAPADCPWSSGCNGGGACGCGGRPGRAGRIIAERGNSTSIGGIIGSYLCK